MTKNALVVENSAPMRRMIAYTLEAAGGFFVVQACDGVEAIKKLKKGFKPQVVITDVDMPNMDGISLVREMRSTSAYKDTPILILTSETSPKKKKEGEEAGATLWLEKPFKVAELQKALDTVVR